MGERQEFPLKVVVYGCLVDELQEAYESGERKFCEMDLPDGLRAGEPLLHRVITTTDGEQSFGFAATAHYLQENYGNEKSQAIAEDMYDYAHMMHASCEGIAEDHKLVLERLEIRWEVNEKGGVVMAGRTFEDCTTVRTRPAQS